MKQVQFGRSSSESNISSGDRVTLPAAKQWICRDIVEQGVHIWGDRIWSMILTGSLARNEATFIRNGDGLKLLGDADCFVVFRRNAALPADSEIVSVQRKIEEHLAMEGLTANVGLSCVTPRFLEGLPPLISIYELRNGGEILWGEKEALSLVPNFRTQDISREDAWRMLCNRMIEHLAFVGELNSASVELGRALHYATVKLILDMATSYLVFAGHYGPSYRERSQNLSILAERPPGEVPFPLKKFAARVEECTSWKLSGDEADSDRRIELWHEAISYMRRLWRWEIIQITNAQEDLTIQGLLFQLAKHQTTSQRLRGWLSAAKRLGWLKSSRRWPRWVWLSLDATPRYLVYRAAAEVSFRLPCLIKHSGAPPRLDVDWSGIQAILPERVSRPETPQDIQWRRLAEDVLWNYSEFLLGTQA